MPHDRKRLRVFLGQDAQRHFATIGKCRAEIHRFAVGFGGDRGFGQSGADILNHVERADALVVFTHAAVRQLDFERHLLCVPSKVVERRYKGRSLQMTNNEVGMTNLTASLAKAEWRIQNDH